MYYSRSTNVSPLVLSLQENRDRSSYRYCPHLYWAYSAIIHCQSYVGIAWHYMRCHSSPGSAFPVLCRKGACNYRQGRHKRHQHIPSYSGRQRPCQHKGSSCVILARPWTHLREDQCESCMLTSVLGLVVQKSPGKAPWLAAQPLKRASAQIGADRPAG